MRILPEDNLYISQSKLAASNTQQEAKTGRIVEDHRAEVAKPNETHKMLTLTPDGSANI